MSERVIDVRELRKSYGDVEAVAGIDLHVDRGEVFALLGPNGAGKTTTVEILEGYRDRTGGEVSVLGHDPDRNEADLKRRIGIVLQSTGVDPYLTVRETVALYAGFYPSPRDVDEVVDLVGLAEKRNTRVNKLSGGQQRRLDVAVALAGDPELLFLDEPTTGFDPNARRNAWEIVKNLTAIGKTIFLTTHFMDEAQYLANRVAVIAAGRIVAEGTPATLGGRDRMQTRVRFHVPEGQAPPAHSGRRRPLADGTIEIQTENPTKVVHELTAWALEHAFVFDLLEVTQPSLEDVYLELTGGEERGRVGGRMSAVGPGGAAVPLHEQGVLAEPGVGVLHVRVPPDVPRDLHGAAGTGAGGDQRVRARHDHVLRGRDGCVRRRVRVFHEHRDPDDVQSRRGDPEAAPRHAAAGRRLHGGPGAPRDGRRRDPRGDHARVREDRVRLADPERRSAPRVHRDVPRRVALVRRAGARPHLA